jgi:membrane-bound ClpP family serine protease
VGLSLGVSVWQRTPVGKKMVLNAVSGEPRRDFVLVGSHGRTVTELRPMGECEFGDTRIQARSELGQIVPSNQPVMAIALSDGVATVRLLNPTQTA